MMIFHSYVSLPDGTISHWFIKSTCLPQKPTPPTLVAHWKALFTCSLLRNVLIKDDVRYKWMVYFMENPSING